MLDLLDEFAARALDAIIRRSGAREDNLYPPPLPAARRAYEYAQAMVAERIKLDAIADALEDVANPAPSPVAAVNAGASTPVCGRCSTAHWAMEPCPDAGPVGEVIR